MDYGRALRIGRAVAGLQQKDVAKLAGVDTSHICLIEAGKRRPSARILRRLCTALGIPESLFQLLGAEAKDLDAADPREVRRAGERLAHLLLRGARRRTSPARLRRKAAPLFRSEV